MTSSCNCPIVHSIKSVCVPTLTYGFFFYLAPEQWTMIPVPVKLFKLIINELSTLLEDAMTGREEEDGDSDDVRMQAPLIETL